MNHVHRMRIVRLTTILSDEVWPAAERCLRWVRNPLAVLSLSLIVSALCGLFLHPQGFVLTFGLAGVLAIGIAWPWLSLQGLSGSLSYEKARVREGEIVTARLSLRNRRPWDAWGLTLHTGTVDGEPVHRDTPAETGMPRASGWKTTEWCWELAPRCRGLYPSHTPRIATGFPFGLWTATRPLAVRRRLIVWPRTFAVGPIPQAAQGRSTEGLSTRSKAGDAGDLFGVRQYRRGDPLKRVHWPQTARHGELIVCELQADTSPRVQIVLDGDPHVHVGSGPDGSLEWAIRIAASFAEGWNEQGADLEAVLNGRAVIARGRSLRARREQLLDAFACLEPAEGFTLSDVLARPVCQTFGSGLRLVVTTDLGLRRLAPHRSSAAREAFVVVSAAAFLDGQAADELAPAPVRPWILVDDRARIAQHVRRSGKEGLRD
jgi:uncharacterized protein (DUF58 family)